MSEFKEGDLVKVVKVLDTGDSKRDNYKKEVIGCVFVVEYKSVPSAVAGHVYQIGCGAPHYRASQKYFFHADELMLVDHDELMVAKSSVVHVLGLPEPIKVKSVLVVDEADQTHVPWSVLSKAEEQAFHEEQQKKQRLAKKDALAKEYASKTAQLSTLCEELTKLGQEMNELQ